jgi:hypothetical protein
MNKWSQPHHPPFYSVNNVLSLTPSPKVIITIGPRGPGKTLGWKLQSIYDMLNDGMETIYIRRFIKEIKEAKKNFTADLHDGDDRLDSLKMEFKGNDFYVDGKLAIRMVTLSQALKLKSVSYKHVRNVIFDEFLTLDKTLDSYGYDEMAIFKEYMDTIFRLRDDLRIILLANAISTTSEYFEAFGFDKPINVKRRYQHPPHTKKVVIEIWGSKKYSEVKQDSELYQLFSPSKHARYAIENEFTFEDAGNVLSTKDIRGHINPLYNLMTAKGVLTVCNYKDDIIKYVIVASNGPHGNIPLFTFDKEMVIYGAMYINTTSNVAQALTSALVTGRLFYDNQKVKKLFLLDLKKIVGTYK